MKRIIRVTALVVLAAVGMAAGWHRFATAAVPAGAEPVLPKQCFRPSAALPPEKRLMLAVLEGALLDLQRSAGPSTPRARRLADEVDAWFAADDESWPGSFLSVCQALGLDVTRAARWRT